MATIKKANETQVTEARRVLLGNEPRYAEHEFWDGRIAYALSRQGVTQQYSRGYGTPERYRFAWRNSWDERLSSDAEKWCAENGLQVEAETYNRAALLRTKEKLNQGYKERLAKIQAQIAELQKTEQEIIGKLAAIEALK